MSIRIIPKPPTSWCQNLWKWFRHYVTECQAAKVIKAGSTLNMTCIFVWSRIQYVNLVDVEICTKIINCCMSCRGMDMYFDAFWPRYHPIIFTFYPSKLSRADHENFFESCSREMTKFLQSSNLSNEISKKLAILFSPLSFFTFPSISLLSMLF